jgi:hypothetical protein
MLADDAFAAIRERHQIRKQYRDDLPPGAWLYDSFAFLENCSEMPGGVIVGKDDRVCILIRRRAWINALMSACSDEILDEATFARGDDKDLQPAGVGLYIEKVMDGSVENDIAALLDEIVRLRGGQ